MTITLERPLYNSKTFTGTTTASYADGAALFEGLGAIFVIKNTGADNSLNYKAIIYLDNGTDALATTMVSITTLDPSTQSAIITGINAPFVKAAVQVVDTTPASHTTFQIDMLKY
jgi:hypothetical protein